MCAFTALGQLTVDNSRTPEELVRDVLVGQGVSVSNVTFNLGPGNVISDQIGAFDGASSNIGLSAGIVLATGGIQVVTGPNTRRDATLMPAFPHPTPDQDLLQLAGSAVGLDPAILEFDLIPSGDSVRFRFVFGSEEYPEYVCALYNDVFGFFLSGPGVNGPFENDAINLALIPGTEVPIAINTVNPGVRGTLPYPLPTNDNLCYFADPNWRDNRIYYVDNTGGTTHQLDGTTVSLTVNRRTIGSLPSMLPAHLKPAISLASCYFC